MIRNRRYKKALIIANGDIRDHMNVREIIDLQDYGEALVISVDGGFTNTIRLGLRPHVVIGDMDSIGLDPGNEVFRDAEFVSAEAEKDESDTQLAADYAVKKGIRDILITGATGGRPDHEFANLMLLASPHLRGLRVRIITGTQEIFSTDRSCIIRGKEGKLISLFSLTPYTFFKETSGLRYGLKNEKLVSSPVRGLSNVFTGARAKLDITEGTLLIMKEL